MMEIETAYTRFCRDRFPVPEGRSDQIDDLEKVAGRKLPYEFSMYLRCFDGGYFSSPAIYSPDEERIVDGLDVLFGLGNSSGGDDLASESNIGRFDDNCPTDLLPIGFTICTNLLLLLLREENFGQVWLKPKYSWDLVFCGETINDFFSNLQDIAEYKLPYR